MSKKFDRVLSDDDVLTLAERSFSFDVEAHHKEIEWFAEKLEQAVLTKLAEQQEPAAWLHKETGDVISSELKDYAPEMLKGYDTPLYRCPVPSSQVNLGSLNAPTEAVEALDAITEQCEKVSNRLGIEDHEQAVLDGELTLANALRASAWELSLIGTLAKNLKERIPEKPIEEHRAEFLEHWDYINSHGLDGGWKAVAWAAWKAARGVKQ